MVANTDSNVPTTSSQPVWINWLQPLIVWTALRLHTISDKLLSSVNHQITTTSAPAKPYTGPTYGKLSNATRKIIAGKIGHEKGYTGNTGWLYIVIAGLIDRKTNTLTISLQDMEIETGLSTSTILRQTKFLETLGLINVDRKEISATSNDVNIYHLIGEGADVSLWNGSSKKTVAVQRSCQNNSTPLAKKQGKDSLQTIPNSQADVAVIEKKPHLWDWVKLI